MLVDLVFSTTQNLPYFYNICLKNYRMSPGLDSGRVMFSEITISTNYNVRLGTDLDCKRKLIRYWLIF